MKKRRLVGFFILVCLIMNNWSQDASNISENDKVTFAMLMNHIQYSIATIEQFRSKATLQQEHDFIINNVNRKKINDEKILSAYVSLLSAIKELTLNENEKDFLKIMQEKEKKQAYTKIFQGFGSVFVPGKSLEAMLASLVYTGVSAALNYQNTINTIDNSFMKEKFQLGQGDFKSIRECEIQLFKEYTELINKYNISEEYIIKKQDIQKLTTILFETANSPDIFLNRLEEPYMQKAFKFFPEYWYHLGCAYQKLERYKEALDCYAEFERLTTASPCFVKDAYYSETAKNITNIYKVQNKFELNIIKKYLAIIEKNRLPSTEGADRLFMAGVLNDIGETQKAKELLLLNISDRKYTEASQDLCNIINYTTTNDMNLKTAYELSRNITINPHNGTDILITIPVDIVKSYRLNSFVLSKNENKTYKKIMEARIPTPDHNQHSIIVKTGKSSDITNYSIVFNNNYALFFDLISSNHITKGYNAEQLKKLKKIFKDQSNIIDNFDPTKKLVVCEIVNEVLDLSSSSKEKDLRDFQNLDYQADFLIASKKIAGANYLASYSKGSKPSLVIVWKIIANSNTYVTDKFGLVCEKK